MVDMDISVRIILSSIGTILQVYVLNTNFVSTYYLP